MTVRTPLLPRRLVAPALAALAVFIPLALGPMASAGVVLTGRVPAAGANLLVLRNSVGTIRIKASAPTTEAAITVRVRARCRNTVDFFGMLHWGWGSSCKTLPRGLVLVSSLHGKTLRLGLNAAGGGSPRHIHEDWTILLPSRFGARIHEGVGKVQITGLKGEIALHVGVGAITLIGLGSGHLAIHDGVGTITARGLRLPAAETEIRLHSGVGAVRIRLASVPPAARGRIVVHTGVGAIDVAGLPCHLARLAVRTGTGGVTASSRPAGFSLHRSLIGASLTGTSGTGLDVRLQAGTGSIDVGWSKTHCP